MDTTQTFYFIINNLIIMFPQFIIVIIGIIFSFMKLSQSPKASKLALIGLGIMFVIGILGIVFTAFQINLPYWLGIQLSMTTYIIVAVRFILNIIWASGLGLLIYAVWAGRENK